jgi:hypothetical protein
MADTFQVFEAKDDELGRQLKVQTLWIREKRGKLRASCKPEPG